MSEYSNYINFSTITNNNRSLKDDVDMDKEVLLLNKFNELVEQFNNERKKNNKKIMIEITKQMRIIHGQIIKLFYEKLNSQGKINHEEYYLLSTLDTSFIKIRKIIKKCEKYIINIEKPNKNHDSVSDSDSEQIHPNIVSDDNVNLVLKQNNIDVNPILPTIVLFYGEWCGHCKQFKPVWNEFEKITNREFINVIKTNSEQLMTKYDIQGIPVVKYFDNKGGIIEYNGERSVNGLADFINQILKKPISRPLAN